MTCAANAHRPSGGHKNLQNLSSRLRIHKNIANKCIDGRERSRRRCAVGDNTYHVNDFVGEKSRSTVGHGVGRENFSRVVQLENELMIWLVPFDAQSGDIPGCTEPSTR